MSTAPTAASEASSPERQPVEVTLTLTDEEGNTETKTLTIPSGPTKVPKLKEQLGVESAKVLWVIKRDGKKRPLSDHETFDVEAGDRFEALVPGGVS
jgi:hypothetical protein